MRGRGVSWGGAFCLEMVYHTQTLPSFSKCLHPWSLFTSIEIGSCLAGQILEDSGWNFDYFLGVEVHNRQASCEVHILRIMVISDLFERLAP